MFYRTIIETLNNWKAASARKPLVLRGARQVGKTTAVNMFSEQFENHVTLNLELKRDRDIFSEEFSIDVLIEAITALKNVELKPGKTLIFIDEIQNAPVAIKMLRYFYEQRKDLYVIAAGSLLEHALDRSRLSFPVGRVQYAYMYPLTFEEFLQASDETQLLPVYRATPVKTFATTRLFELFHQYTMIGGMPEIVRKYIARRDLASLQSCYESLLTSFLDDADKYGRNPTMRLILRHCIESVPYEAGKRIKFQGFGRSNYRSREVGEALRMIERAMLLYLIYPSTAVEIPLLADLKKSPLLQFVDTGLLNHFVGLQPQFFRFDDLHAFYRGRIAEHIVRQELIAYDATHNKKMLFWVRERSQSNAEVDVVVPFQNLAIPVEVKSGKTGTLRSLHQFIDAAPHAYAVRLYKGHFEITDAKTPAGKRYRLLNLPYFLAGRMDDYLALLVQ
ncbi:MAG: ATP-binding protein [bacterium]